MKLSEAVLGTQVLRSSGFQKMLVSEDLKLSEAQVEKF
jgi:hypothetical protein